MDKIFRFSTKDLKKYDHGNFLENIASDYISFNSFDIKSFLKMYKPNNEICRLISSSITIKEPMNEDAREDFVHFIIDILRKNTSELKDIHSSKFVTLDEKFIVVDFFNNENFNTSNLTITLTTSKRV